MLGVGIAPRHGHARWVRRVLPLLVSGAIAVGVGAYVDRVVVGAALPGSLNTRRVAPVPVSASACAYVPGLNDAAASVRAELDYAIAGYAAPNPRANALGLPARPVRVSWSSSRFRLRDQLRVLDVTIARSRSTFPETVRQSLDEVRGDIAVGVVDLESSRSADELLVASGDVWSAAVRAFAQAGDLVGSQCGTPLAASAPLFGPCAIATCTTP